MYIDWEEFCIKFALAFVICMGLHAMFTDLPIWIMILVSLSAGTATALGAIKRKRKINKNGEVVE